MFSNHTPGMQKEAVFDIDTDHITEGRLLCMRKKGAGGVHGPQLF